MNKLEILKLLKRLKLLLRRKVIDVLRPSIVTKMVSFYLINLMSFVKRMTFTRN